MYYFSVETCTTPAMADIERSTNIYPAESMTVNYGTEVKIECQYGSVRINRTLYCSYKGNGKYDLLGDEPVCPGLLLSALSLKQGSETQEKTKLFY